MRRWGIAVVVGMSACVGQPPSAPDSAATTTGTPGSSGVSPGSTTTAVGSTSAPELDSTTSAPDGTDEGTTGAAGTTTTGAESVTGGSESSSGGVPQSLPELECEQEGNVASTQSMMPALVTFTNVSGEIRRLYWLDLMGERHFLFEYAPGQVEDWNSWITHVFLVADEADQCITIFVVEDEGPHEISLY